MACLIAIILLTAVNFYFHGFFQGSARFLGFVCTDTYDFFPGPLLHSEYRFTDYFDTQKFRPDRGQTSQLPPTTILLFQLSRFLTVATGPVASVIIFSIFQMVVFSASIGRLLGARGGIPELSLPARFWLALVISTCSYPVYFAVDRGHFALIACALINFAIDSHLRGRRWSAAILIGLAAALRITPLVFAAIYLNQRDFRYLLAATATALISWAISLALVPLWLDGYGLDNWLESFSNYAHMYISWPGGLGWSSSLYNLARLARYLNGIPIDAILDSAHFAEQAYSFASIAILALIVFRIRHTSSITAFALLAWASIALPHVTGDYYLAGLIAPMVLLATRSKPDLVALALLILLLVPKDYFYYYVTVYKLFDFKVMDLFEYQRLLRRGYTSVSIQSLIINPLLLVVLGLRLAWRDSDESSLQAENR
jgi:hypothetical protein